MPAKWGRVLGQCIYCGEVKSLTKDHIPPKNLFPRPRPNNLITVPSCVDCNHQSSMDDEYFRMIISTRREVSKHSGAQRLWPAIHRSLLKQQKLDLRDLIFQAGPTMGQTLDIDLKRIDKVVIRITKGILFREEGRYFPESYKVSICSNPFSDRNQLLGGESTAPLVTAYRVFGEGVFSYGRLSLNEGLNISAWSLLFFGGINFICVARLGDSLTVNRFKLNPLGT